MTLRKLMGMANQELKSQMYLQAKRANIEKQVIDAGWKLKGLGHRQAFPDNPRNGMIYYRGMMPALLGEKGGVVIPENDSECAEMLIMRWRGFKEDDGSKCEEVDLVYEPTEQVYLVFSEVIGSGEGFQTLGAALRAVHSYMPSECMFIPLHDLYEVVKMQVQSKARATPNRSDALSELSKADAYKDDARFGKWS